MLMLPGRVVLDHGSIPPVTADADQRRGDAPIPVVWCVDVEPKERQLDDDPGPDWVGVLETVENLERRRSSLQDATGAPVHFSWFWRADPQIEQVYGSAEWGLVRYRDVLDSTDLEGDAHGIHPHYWRRADSSSVWIEDIRDPAWMEHCVRLSFEAFHRQVGSPPLITRGGTRVLSSRVARLLDRLGVRVDCTIEPGMPPDHIESNLPKPDYTRVASRPYQPVPSNFRRARRFGLGLQGLTMLPLTTRFPAGGRRPRSLFHPWFDANVTIPGVDALLADGQRYLAFAIRSDGPIATWWPNVERLLDHLERHPMAPRFRFATPLDALDLLAGTERVGAP